MGEAFNVNQYWLKRGRTYISETLPAEYHRLQEGFLLDVLAASRISLNRILEIGCGFGRITKLLAETFPQAQITALDLSPEQLANAQRYCGQARNVTFQQYDLYSDRPFPGRDYDAAIAIEVFLHHPRSVVQGLFVKLAAVSRHIVNIDWSEDWPWKTAEHVWVHDYSAVYDEAGLKCATFVLPQKVDGMQQKLFIAAKELSPEITALPQHFHTERTLDALPNNPAPTAQTGQTGEPWPQRVHLVAQELQRLVPAGSSLILVNDDQWGNEQQTLKTHRIIPFSEHQGRYWGPPPDDQTAIHELERLRQAGACYLAFAWNCFWWLDHYKGFCEYLRNRYPCIHSDERLVVFDLR